MAWVVLQLGSREHYSIPIALQSVNQLDCLVTYSWLTKFQSDFANPIFPSLAHRRTCSIPDTSVRSRTLARFLIDGKIKLKKTIFLAFHQLSQCMVSGLGGE